MPGDSEKPTSGVTTHTNAGNTGQQTSVSGTQAQSLAIGTPGISASPLLAEFSGGTDGVYANALPTVSGKTSVTEQPLERLIKAVSQNFGFFYCSWLKLLPILFYCSINGNLIMVFRLNQCHLKL